MIKQQHQLMVGLLAAVDACVVAAAALLAWVLRRVLVPPVAGYKPGGDYDFWPGSWESYFKEPLLLFAVPICLATFLAFRLYRPRRDRTLAGELAQLGKAASVAVVAMIVVLWGVGNDQLVGGRIPLRPVVVLDTELDAGRVQIILFAVLLVGMMAVHRTAFRAFLRWLRRRGLNLRHVAIIGVGRTGRIVAGTLDRNSWTGLRVAYFISHRQENRLPECMGRPVLGGLQDLESTLSACKVDAVYLALPSREAACTHRLLRRLERFPVDVRIVPDVNPRYVPQSMAVHELDGMPVLSYRESPTCGVGGAAKRALDVAGALAALVLGLPVLGVCAALVRLSGPGPVIFRQTRVGLGGEVFRMYKLRTMVHAADEAGALRAAAEGAGVPGWTTRDDPRITPVGRWLRRTSLDELPQLFNVLRGEMSLVGPRPERPELIERFREDWRGYMLRQHVKAGMTGWAQVNGLRGDTCLRRRLRYDLYYVRNWSLAFDLWILAITPLRGFVHRNAH